MLSQRKGIKIQRGKGSQTAFPHNISMLCHSGIVYQEPLKIIFNFVQPLPEMLVFSC